MRKILAKHLDGDGGIRQLIVIAVPMVISQACETIMMFTDRVFLSYLSPSHMAAALSGGLTAFMFTTFFLGLTGYTTALVAQYLGSNKKRFCTISVTQAVVISIVSYPLILSLIPLSRWIFEKTGLDASQQQLSFDYLRIILIGSIFFLGRNIFNSFFSGIGKTRIIMISSIMTMSINVFANYILIFGKFGLPALGIKGAAIGTIISTFCGFIFMLCAYLIYTKKRYEYMLRKSFKLDLDVMKKLFHFGYPGGLELLLNLMAFDLMVLLFQSYGSNVSASVTIALNWDMVVFVPLIGINIAVTSLTGRYMGKNEPNIASRAAFSGVKLALFYGVLMIILFLSATQVLVNMFLPEGQNVDEIAPLAKYMVKFVSLYILADGFNIVFSGALRGAGDTFWTMVIAVLCHWLLAVESFITVKVLKLNPELAWAIFVFTIPLIGAAYFLRFMTGKWRKIKVV